MFSTSSRDRLLRTALGVLWAQWTEMGVGGTRGTEVSLIDPEVLLLATSRFSRFDPRLFDVVLDWLVQYSGSLDVTRLRRLGTQRRIHDDKVLVALIDFMRQRSLTEKWDASSRALLAREERAPYGGPEALFIAPDGRPLHTPGAKDTFFLEHGLERPELVMRDLSLAPDSRRSALGRLRLRTLVGQGVRAEVLLFLATHDHAHGRLIASQAGFSQRQVADYLTQLSESGFAESWEEGRTVQFRLSPEFVRSLGPLAAYVDWAKVWSVMARLWDSIDATRGLADYAASKVWRETLQEIRAGTPVDGANFSVPVPGEYAGEEILEYAEQYVLRACEVVDELAR